MKNNTLSKILSGIVAITLIISLSSCGGAGNPTPEPGNVDGVSEQEQSQGIKRGNLNLLTGEYNLPDNAVGKRPVSIMINNIKIALPQYGISQADIIYEALAEGGITRMMAIFSDYSTLPKTGPIRSARDYYLDFAAPYDAIFTHWGTSNIAASAIKNRNIDNIDGMYWSAYYYTDKALAKQKGVEHSRFIEKDGFAKILAKKDERTQSNSKTPAFNFVLPEEEVVPTQQKAEEIRARFSSSYDAAFKYDAQKKIYMLSEFGNPHMDAGSKTQLSFTNVVIIYAPVSQIEGGGGKVDVDLTGGSGIFATRGGVENIKWSKGDSAHDKPFVYKNADGNPVKFNTGKTYVCVVPTSQQDATQILVKDPPASSTTAE